MIRVGDMVRAGNGPIVRVADIADGVAVCQHVDQNGRLHMLTYTVLELSPWWRSCGPRSLWPDTTEGDEALWGKRKRPKVRKPKRNKKTTIKVLQPPPLSPKIFDFAFGDAP